MRWVLCLVFAGTATLAVGAPPVRKAPSSKSATAKKAPVAAKTAQATSKKALHLASTGKTRGRKGKVARRRTPPPPPYQLHPDPERYQQIQQALADRGYFKGEANGTWGDDSIDALRRFQADQNLPNDGKITALSLTALGLGPRHDGSTASTVPVQPPTPESLPTVTTPPNTEPPELSRR